MKISGKLLTTLTIWKRVGELILNPGLIREINNWPELLFDFILSPKGNYVLHLRRGGALIVRGDSFDKWPVSEVIVRDDYRLRPLQSPPATVIDLGAGIGDFCVYTCLLYPKAKIFAYEPDSETYEILVKNIKLNLLINKVFVHKQAVTRKGSPKKQYTNQTKGFPALISRYSKGQLMFATTLYEIFLFNKIESCDLLKIDIEGAEYAVLYTLTPALFKKIKRIHLECHNFDNKKYNSKFLSRFLEQQGFSVEIKSSWDRAICVLYAQNKNYLFTRRVD